MCSYAQHFVYNSSEGYGAPEIPLWLSEPTKNCCFSLVCLCHLLLWRISNTHKSRQEQTKEYNESPCAHHPSPKAVHPKPVLCCFQLRLSLNPLQNHIYEIYHQPWDCFHQITLRHDYHFGKWLAEYSERSLEKNCFCTFYKFMLRKLSTPYHNHPLLGLITGTICTSPKLLLWDYIMNIMNPAIRHFSLKFLVSGLNIGCNCERYFFFHYI